MSIRKQQIESVLKRAISELLIRKISDPRIVGMVSITSVDVSPELSRATIWISVIPREQEKKTVAGLNHAAPFIHGLLRKAVTFRTVPHLDFRLDHDLKKQSSVLQAINKGVSREKPLEPDASDEHDEELNQQNENQHQSRSTQERARRDAGRAGDIEASHRTDTSHPADPNGQESSK